jgi:hypothetical protein
MARSPDDRYQDAMAMQHALLAVAEALVDATLLQTLSDAPPSFQSAGSAPRVSSDRLRTLEFAIDAEPIAARPHAAALLTSTVDIPLHESEDEQFEVTLRPPRRRRNAALSALVLCGAAAAAFALWQRDAPDASALDVAAHAQAEPMAQVKQPAVAPSSTIMIQLRSVPANAAVSVDGMPAAGAVLELPRDQRNRVIKVAAPGKAPWQVVHHASSDASYDVWLVDTDPPSPRASTASTHQARRNAAAVVRRKTPKQPPSALRKLDF